MEKTKKQTFRDTVIVGLALFAMFFGSGNLIFPPFLGRTVGPEYIIGIIGFMIMGVGIPLLGIMATAKGGGNFENVANRVGKKFSVLLMTALILAIGPGLAIPRTAATTYEIGVLPFIQIAPVIILVVYFIINLLFVIKPTSVVDMIGKFLTPALLLVLLILIVKGMLDPAAIVDVNPESVFSRSLLEGYQTMDALASVCFGGMLVASIKSKGYTDTKQIIKITLKASLIGVVGLGVVYGGLMYLGAHSSYLVGTLEKTALVTAIAKHILGEVGIIFLAAAVSLACLTTSIGLTSTGAEYFSKLCKGKISYKAMAYIISIVSLLIALMGVDNIVQYTVPVLSILYPIIIVLILMTLMGNFAKENLILQIVTYSTLVVSIIDVLSTQFKIEFIRNIIDHIPLAGDGFAWVVPSIISFILAKAICAKKNK